MRTTAALRELGWALLVLASVAGCQAATPKSPTPSAVAVSAESSSQVTRLLQSAAFLQWELPEIPGTWHSRVLTLGAAQLDLLISPRIGGMDDDAIERWVSEAAKGVASYYGTFPGPRALVVVVASGEPGINGTTLGEHGPSLLMQLGADYTEERAHESWVLTHELLHVTFPSLDRSTFAWVGEGLSTYLEPIVRVRAGTLTTEEMWRDLLRDAAQGLPEQGDQGLDKTPTWGRTYWGGALFWLEADVQIRQQTQGERSLDDALRAIAEQGGTVNASWKIERLLTVADQATGTRVLTELHRLRGQSAAALDLETLWQQLGVRLGEGQRVVFDDGAPLATLRRELNEPGKRADRR